MSAHTYFCPHLKTCQVSSPAVNWNTGYSSKSAHFWLPFILLISSHSARARLIQNSFIVLAQTSSPPLLLTRPPSPPSCLTPSGPRTSNSGAAAVAEAHNAPRAHTKSALQRCLYVDLTTGLTDLTRSSCSGVGWNSWVSFLAATCLQQRQLEGTPLLCLPSQPHKSTSNKVGQQASKRNNNWLLFRQTTSSGERVASPQLCQCHWSLPFTIKVTTSSDNV